MISLRKYLDWDPRTKVAEAGTSAPPARAGVSAPIADTHEFRDAVLRIFRLLLEGMLFHLVRGREQDWKVLEESLQRVLTEINPSVPPMRVVELGADALMALEQYNQATGEYFRKQREDLQGMVAMLTDTVTSISTGSRRSMMHLEQIEKQIERASDTDDVSRLKANLGECLKSLREEAARQRTDSDRTISRLQEELERAEPAARYAPVVPGRLAQVRAAQPSKYAALFIVHRLDLIKSRFGEQVRYQVVSRLGEHLKQRLGPQDRVLRWKGGSYLVFVERTATYSEVRSELDRMSECPGEQYLEMASRSVLLPMAFSWALLRVEQFPSLADLLAEVDRFVDSQVAAQSAGFHPWGED